MPSEFQMLKMDRREIIKACNGSSIPKRQWCQEHGISYSTFMCWQRILCDKLVGASMVIHTVVPLEVEPQPLSCSAKEVTIQKDGIAIRLQGTNSELVVAIVRGSSSC